MIPGVAMPWWTLLLVVVAGGAAFTALHSARARRRWPARGEWVALAGARLHVWRCGSGPPLVLVHGMYAMSANFPDAFIERLAGRYTVLVPDRPGHGYSDRFPGHAAGCDENVAALRAMARALDLGPALLVAHSYGVTSALRWALDAPAEVHGVVALAPLAMPAGAWERFRGALLRPVPWIHTLAHTVAVPIGLVARWFVRHRAWSPMRAPRAGNASRSLAMLPASLAACAEELAALHGDLHALAPRYGGLTQPLAIVVGEGDLVTRARIHAEPLAARIPHARIRVIPGRGHQIQFVAVEEVLAAVDEVADASTRRA